MTVYVDNAGIAATVGRHTSRWSHLTADDQEELHRFAVDVLGLRRSYFQTCVKNRKRCPPETCPHWHYDVTAPKREQALRMGAQPMDIRKWGEIIAGRRAVTRPTEAAPAAVDPQPEAGGQPGRVRRDVCAVCGQPGRLYPGGWRCDQHGPAAVRTNTGAACGLGNGIIVEGSATSPAPDWPPVAAVPSSSSAATPGRRKARYNPTLQRHTWTPLKEHHKRCDFCGVHVENHTKNHRDWWQTWTWVDGRTGTNEGEPKPKVPKCPGPPSAEPGA